MGGWVVGLTLTIKLISAQLNYAAAGAGLSLAKPCMNGSSIHENILKHFLLKGVSKCS